MNRQLRKGELTLKDMSVIREGDRTEVQKEKRKGQVKDYSLNHKVTVEWDLNDDAMRDNIFKLKVDDYEVHLDAEEMMRYLRWV